MDLATLIGLIGALAIIVASILLGASSQIFFNVPSLLIVVVGSFFVVMAKFSLGQFIGAFKVAARAFKFRLPSVEESIAELVDIANIARKQGTLALEEKEVSSPFLKAGIQLMVDGQNQETIRGILDKERLLTLERNRWGAKIFSALGDVGPAMAVALLTTLYGAMMATMICLPIADKLNLRMTEEARMQQLWIDALGAIQDGINPRIVEQMLRSYLPANKRDVALPGQPGE